MGKGVGLGQSSHWDAKAKEPTQGHFVRETQMRQFPLARGTGPRGDGWSIERSSRMFAGEDLRRWNGFLIRRRGDPVVDTVVGGGRGLALVWL